MFQDTIWWDDLHIFFLVYITVGSWQHNLALAMKFSRRIRFRFVRIIIGFYMTVSFIYNQHFDVVLRNTYLIPIYLARSPRPHKMYWSVQKYQVLEVKLLLFSPSSEMSISNNPFPDGGILRGNYKLGERTEWVCSHTICNRLCICIYVINNEMFIRVA